MTALHTERLKLRSDVRRVCRRGGQVVLVSAAGRPLRISSSGDRLVALLIDGATFGELSAHLRFVHPAVVSVDLDAAVVRFLDALTAASMLEGRAGVPRTSSLTVSMDIDRVIGRLVRPLIRLPGFAVWLVPVASLVGLVVSGLYISTQTPRIADLIDHFSWAGLALVVTFVIPLHEIGHAVSAALVGVRVAEAGFEPGPLGLIRPCIRTPNAVMAHRWDRFAIAAAGPAVDAITCGVTACAALVWPEIENTIRFVFLCSLLTLIASTGPLHDGDGSHMLAAYLDDDLARESALLKRSRLSSRRTVRLYRIASVLHTAAAALALWWLR